MTKKWPRPVTQVGRIIAWVKALSNSLSAFVAAIRSYVLVRLTRTVDLTQEWAYLQSLDGLQERTKVKVEDFILADQDGEAARLVSGE